MGGSAAIATGDTVFVTSCVSNCVSTTTCGNGPNLDVNVLGNLVYDDAGYGAYTSAKATTSDKPVTPGSRYISGAFSNSTPDLGITVSPTLGATGGIYKVYHVFSSTANNVNTNLIVAVTNVDGCTLSWTETDKFQRKYGQPAQQNWQLLGFLTNNVDTSTPTIRFYYQSGRVSAGEQCRLVTEVFRFTLYERCTDIPTVGVTGPLAGNSATVTVTGVSGTATNVTVYQNTGSGMVKIGEKTSGVVAGNNDVAVSGLVKGAEVAATQTIEGQEGCVPMSGLRVGGGANPRLRLALSIKENPTATGPVGSDGRTNANSNIHFLGASSVLSGSCPGDGTLVIYPSNEWQTVTLQRGPDPANPVNTCVQWNPTSGTLNNLQGAWGILESIALASDDETDNGPFDIYIDNLANGTNGIFQDFEGFVAGTAAGAVFNQPSYSGTTSGNIMTAPNEASISNTAADAGTKSTRVRWQFNDGATNRWMRFNTYNTSVMPNPLVNLDEPISFRILLLPVGSNPVPPAAPFLSATSVGSNAVLNWTGAHRLQQSTNVVGPYATVTGVTMAPYTNSFSSDPQRFFRLVD